jgi:hypothetical protein
MTRETDSVSLRKARNRGLPARHAV